MIEEVEKEIYRIGIPLPDNPLKELNCYFIRGKERDLIIDTGFNRRECRAALLAGLKELGSDSDRRDVFLTHFHTDHSGLASDCIGENGKIYISTTDARYLDWSLKRVLKRENGIRLLAEGFPKEELDMADAVNMAFVMQMRKNDPRITGVEDGDILRVGKYELQLIQVPGHTPGSLMLWEEEKQIMFTGDHVLFDITPNITCWYQMENSLGAYLDSLRRVRGYPVRIACPGHRKAGDYTRRIDQLLEHHDRRIQEAFETIETEPGLCAYEITARMTWQIRVRNWGEFPPMQKYFAVRECIAHLDYLRNERKITRKWENGNYRYYLS